MSTSDNIKLRMLGLPVIQDLNSLSVITRVSKATLYNYSVNADFQYKRVEIPKKNGGVREILQPNKGLKAIQAWILVSILNKLNSSSASKGFEIGSSTYENAKPHIGSNAVLSIDLKDFFNTIKSRYVFHIFKILGYNNVVATILTRLCTCDGKLPQGGPCSPKLSNLYCLNLDNRIQGYVGRRGIIYTRYADDLTFSSLNPNNLIKIKPTIFKIIESENLVVNHRKTRFCGTRSQKKVTGLILTDNNTIGVGRSKYNELRYEFFKLTKIAKSDSPDIKYINHLIGWLSYLKSVDLKRYQRISKYIVKLKSGNEDKMISLINSGA